MISNSITFTTLLFATVATFAIAQQQPPFNGNQGNSAGGGFNGNQGNNAGGGFNGNQGNGGSPVLPPTNGASGNNGNRWGASLEQLLGNLIGKIHTTPGLNQNELSQLFAIMRNQNLTKTQVKTQMQEWASRQGSDMQKLFNDVSTKVSQDLASAASEAESKASGLSQQAKAAYDQFKAVITNEGLSRIQECERLDSISASLDSSIRQELYQIFGGFRACPNSGGNQQQQNGNNQGGFRNAGDNGQQQNFGGQNQQNGQGFIPNQGGFGGQNQGGFNGGNSNGNQFGGNLGQNGQGFIPNPQQNQGSFGGQSGFNGGNLNGQQNGNSNGGQQNGQGFIPNQPQNQGSQNGFNGNSNGGQQNGQGFNPNQGK